MIRHRLEVYNQAGNLLEIFDKWSDLTWNKRLNNSGFLEFVLDFQDPKCRNSNLLGGLNFVKYYRNNILTWSGEIDLLDDYLDPDKGKVKVRCVSWFELLKFRYTAAERIFTSTNEGLILQTLVNETQALTDGDFGITIGSNTSADLRDRTYQYKNIRDAFIQMSEVIDGLDFEITPDRELNIYERKGTDLTSSVILNYADNIKSLRRIRDWSQLKNKTTALGEGTLTQTGSDPALSAVYKLREDIIQHPDISEATTLLGHAQEEVSVYKNPQRIFNIVLNDNCERPDLSEYDVGDTVQLIIEEGLIKERTQVRIMGINVKIDNEGTESVSLIVSL